MVSVLWFSQGPALAGSKCWGEGSPWISHSKETSKWVDPNWAGGDGPPLENFLHVEWVWNLDFTNLKWKRKRGRKMEGSFVSVFGLGHFSLTYGSRDVCSCVHVCTCSSPTLSPPAISVYSPVVVVVNGPRVTRKHTFRFLLIKWLLRDNLIFPMKLPFFLSLRGMLHWNTAGPSYTLKENKDESHRIEPSLKLEAVAMVFWYLWAKFCKLLAMWG